MLIIIFTNKLMEEVNDRVAYRKHVLDFTKITYSYSTEFKSFRHKCKCLKYQKRYWIVCKYNIVIMERCYFREQNSSTTLKVLCIILKTTKGKSTLHCCLNYWATAEHYLYVTAQDSYKYIRIHVYVQNIYYSKFSKKWAQKYPLASTT